MKSASMPCSCQTIGMRSPTEICSSNSSTAFSRDYCFEPSPTTTGPSDHRPSDHRKRLGGYGVHVLRLTTPRPLGLPGMPRSMNTRLPSGFSCYSRTTRQSAGSISPSDSITSSRSGLCGITRLCITCRSWIGTVRYCGSAGAVFWAAVSTDSAVAAAT